MLLFFSLYCSLFVSLVAGICCKNHKWVCGLGNSIDCTPNCPDGVSYCDTDVETCNSNGQGDGWGGCVQIATVTASVPTYTTTIVSYTDTLTATSGIDTVYTTDTAITSILQTETRTVSEVVTSTSTSVYTPQVKLRALARREVTSTRTVTVNPCTTTQYDRCTSTSLADFTRYVEATTTVTIAAVSADTSTTTTTVTTQITTVDITTVTSVKSSPASNTAELASSTVRPVNNNGLTTSVALDTPSSSTASAATSSGAPSSGLSNGDKAGIGIGVSVIIIGLVGGTFVMCCKRRKKEGGSGRGGSGGGGNMNHASFHSEPLPQAHSVYYVPHGGPQHYQHGYQGVAPLPYQQPSSYTHPGGYPVSTAPMTQDHNGWTPPLSQVPNQYTRLRSPGGGVIPGEEDVMTIRVAPKSPH